MRKLFTLFAALAVSFGLSKPMMAEEYVTWSSYNVMTIHVQHGESYQSGGITLSTNNGRVYNRIFDAGDYTFSFAGTCSRIEINATDGDVSYPGWNHIGSQFVWDGSDASEVTMCVNSNLNNVNSITFTITPATSGTCGPNLTWEFNESTHTLTISGTGAMDDYLQNNFNPYHPTSTPNTAPWASHWASIENVVIDEGVTMVGRDAFSHHVYITSVSLPSTLTTIKESAFYGCYDLSTIHFSEGLQSIGDHAFYSCDGLTSLVFPSTLTTLEQFAFLTCMGLTSIDLPSSVQTIGNYVFQGCSYLTDVTVHWTSLGGVSLGNKPFNSVPTSNVNLHVPKGTESLYASTAPWSGFHIVTQVASIITPPTADTELMYNGSPQPLVTAGVAKGGTLNYKLGDGDWSETIPTATNAGNYTVYYKVVGDANHADFTPTENSIAVSIAKANVSYTAPEAILGLEYTGAAKTLITAGSAEGGEMQYKVDDGAWSTALPQATAIGNHTVYYKVVGDANHSDVAETSFVVTIKMTVYVKKIGTSVHDPYTVEPTTTVFELKQLLATANSLEAEMINLIYAGHSLENGRPLSDYAISHESVIQMAAGRSMTANEDTQHPGTYYTTFYDSALRFVLPDGVEAYVATLSDDALIMTKIAEEGEILPENTAVILKAEDANVRMGWTEDTPVSFEATSNLHGVDAPTAAPANCYVLSGHSSDNSVTGVGFYQYNGTLKAHKAYAVIDGGIAYAPKKLRFVFNTTTGVESIQPSEVSSQKVLRNGQLIIIRNGVEYNANGQIVK